MNLFPPLSLLAIAIAVLSVGSIELYFIASTLAPVFTVNWPAFLGVPAILVFRPTPSSAPILSASAVSVSSGVPVVAVVPCVPSRVTKYFVLVVPLGSVISVPVSDHFII